MRRVGLAVCLILAAALLTAVAEEIPEMDLVRCEISVYGGMENEDRVTVLEEVTRGSVPVLTIREKDRVKSWPTSADALKQLAAELAAMHPEGWDSLPESEWIALDAPTRCLTLTCRNGVQYSLTNEKESPGKALWLAQHYMESYAETDAQCFEIALSSFYGNTTEFTVELSEPGTVWIDRGRSEGPHTPTPPGSEYSETLVVHGRLPGRTELIVRSSSAQNPDGEGNLRPKVYVLEIQNDYNVTCVEERWQ